MAQLLAAADSRIKTLTASDSRLRTDLEELQELAENRRAHIARMLAAQKVRWGGPHRATAVPFVRMFTRC